MQTPQSFWVAAAAFDAATQALLTYGGMGYAKEYQVERLFRESILQRLAPDHRAADSLLHRGEGARAAEILLAPMRRAIFALKIVLKPYCTLQ